MDWDGEGPDPRESRRPSWGCLAALIVGAVGLVVVVALAAHWLGGIGPPVIR